MEGGKLTPDEMKFYRGVFVTLDWMNNKQIPCNPQLKLLLTASRLPVATLGQLWTLSFALAKNQNRDWLSDRDLCIVLRLVAMAQTGQVPSYEGSRVDGLPLPKIDITMLREAHKKAIEEGKVPAPGGAAAPAAAASPAAPPAVPPRQPGPPPPSPAAAATPSATPTSPAAAATPAATTPAAAPAAAASAPPPQPGQIDWSMSDKQKQDYQRSFDQIDLEKKGIIPALNAVGFLRKSKLPEEVLREIWKLSDLNRDGALDLHEFCIAMHLVLKARSNIPLPPTLPPCLLPGKTQAQLEAEEKTKKEAEARMREQQAKEQAAKEQAEQAAKEQQEKEAKERELKEQQQKEQQERQQKQQQEQRAKEQAKQQEEVKSQPDNNNNASSEQKGEEKSASSSASGEGGDQKTESEAPASGASKFRRAAPGEGSGLLAAAAAASPAAAPRSRPREPPRSAEGDVKRTRSPAARNRSPATRTNVKPGEPTIGWDNTVKLDREDPLAPLTSPSKPGEAVKLQPAIRAWIEALLSEKIAPGLGLFDALKSGVRLCKMLNVIDPNSILDISTSISMRELNISTFLDALRSKGFKPSQLFLVGDLMEQKDMEAVYSTIIALDQYAETVGFEGPRLKR